MHIFFQSPQSIQSWCRTWWRPRCQSPSPKLPSPVQVDDQPNIPKQSKLVYLKTKNKPFEDKMQYRPPGIFSAPGVGQFLVASCQLRQLNGTPQLSGRPKMFLYYHQYSLMCLHWFILVYWSRHIPWSNRQLCQRVIHQLLQQKNQHCSLPARSKGASPRPACPRPCAPLISILSWLS